MPTAHVNVKYVNQPTGASRFGSVKDGNGEYWSVPVAMLNQFAPNQSVNVEYDTTDKGGRTYKNIKRVVAGPASPPAGAQPQRYTEDPVKAEQIAVLAIVKEWVGRIPVGDTGALIHAIRSAREAWKQAYAKPLPTKVESGRPSDDMNDEIPGFDDDGR